MKVMSTSFPLLPGQQLDIIRMFAHSGLHRQCHGAHGQLGAINTYRVSVRFI